MATVNSEMNTYNHAVDYNRSNWGNHITSNTVGLQIYFWQNWLITHLCDRFFFCSHTGATGVRDHEMASVIRELQCTMTMRFTSDITRIKIQFQ